MKYYKKTDGGLDGKSRSEIGQHEKIDALIGMKMVNMNFYPICPDPELTVGVRRHSNLGALTVLLQDGIGGLYVKVEEDIEGVAKKGEWVEIPPIDGALVINVGDTLQILSNGNNTHDGINSLDIHPYK
ncbi:hypothetical protein ACOSQ3_028173 [Xanthoceras sorbifolium]